MTQSAMTDPLTDKLRAFVKQEKIQPDPNFALPRSGVHAVVNCVFSAKVKFVPVVVPLLARLEKRLPDKPELTFSEFIGDVDAYGGFQKYAEEVLTRHRLGRNLKVEVAYCAANFFVEKGYEIQAQFQLPDDLESEEGKKKEKEIESLVLNDLVTKVHGVGPVLARYLMWLLGDERHVKPDTLLTRLLARISDQALVYGKAKDMERIKLAITAVAREMETTPARLDNALWIYESTLKQKKI